MPSRKARPAERAKRRKGCATGREPETSRCPLASCVPRRPDILSDIPGAMSRADNKDAVGHEAQFVEIVAPGRATALKRPRLRQDVLRNHCFALPNCACRTHTRALRRSLRPRATRSPLHPDTSPTPHPKRSSTAPRSAPQQAVAPHARISSCSARAGCASARLARRRPPRGGSRAQGRAPAWCPPRRRAARLPMARSASAGTARVRRQRRNRTRRQTWHAFLRGRVQYFVEGSLHMMFDCYT